MPRMAPGVGVFICRGGRTMRAAFICSSTDSVPAFPTALHKNCLFSLWIIWCLSHAVKMLYFHSRCKKVFKFALYPGYLNSICVRWQFLTADGPSGETFDQHMEEPGIHSTLNLVSKLFHKQKVTFCGDFIANYVALATVQKVFCSNCEPTRETHNILELERNSCKPGLKTCLKLGILKLLLAWRKNSWICPCFQVWYEPISSAAHSCLPPGPACATDFWARVTGKFNIPVFLKYLCDISPRRERNPNAIMNSGMRLQQAVTKDTTASFEAQPWQTAMKR